MRPFFSVLIGLFYVLISFFSCQQTFYRSKQNLFSLSYGQSIKALAYQDSQKFSLFSPVLFSFSQGFFLISQQNGSKVLLLNVYGDLVTFFHRASPRMIEQLNLFQKEIVQGQNFTNGAFLSNFEAIFYPFGSIQALAFSQGQRFFIAHDTPQSLVWDPEKQVYLKNKILVFSPQKEFEFSLGQEGPDGQAFPHITQMLLTDSYLLVITQELNQYRLYAYNRLDPRLNLSFERVINKALFAHWMNLDGANAQINHLYIEPWQSKLYVSLDLYRDTDRQETVVKEGQYLFSYNLHNQMIERELVLGVNTELKQVGLSSFGDRQTQLEYQFLGVYQDHKLYLRRDEEQRLHLNVLNANNLLVLDQFLNLDSLEDAHEAYRLLPEGFLVVVLSAETGVSYSWWSLSQWF